MACAAAWARRLVGACFVGGIALVPWPGYQGASNEEGGFLNDSP